MDVFKAAIVVLILGLAGALAFLFLELRAVRTELQTLRAASAELREETVSLADRAQKVEAVLAAKLSDYRMASAACTNSFPTGLYQLSTETPFGPGLGRQYEITHVSLQIAGWNLNAGIAVGDLFGFNVSPEGLYLDYNGDGKNDTAIAARFFREIPFVGNTLADRLLANAKDNQNLYAVFGCEWQQADFTSHQHMASGVSSLWDYMVQYSIDIAQWIEESEAAVALSKI